MTSSKLEPFTQIDILNSYIGQAYKYFFCSWERTKINRNDKRDFLKYFSVNNKIFYFCDKNKNEELRIHKFVEATVLPISQELFFYVF